MRVGECKCIENSNGTNNAHPFSCFDNFKLAKRPSYNTLRPRRNVRRFADDPLRLIFSMKMLECH